MGSAVYFAADDGMQGNQLWSSDGTSSGTAMVADINGNQSANPSNLTMVDGVLDFAAYSAGHGYQLWSTNGTTAGTLRASNLVGNMNVSPTNFVVLGTTLFFTTNNGQTMWVVSY
jgi:ELWxxDGT repeat protein